MTINYNVTGTKRKLLAEHIAMFMGIEKKYLGAPTFAYQIGCFTVSKDGVVSFKDRSYNNDLDELMAVLAAQGFHTEDSISKSPVQQYSAEGPAPTGATATDRLTIQMPAASFTPEALNNLHSLIAAKGKLLRKALGVDLLPIQMEADTVSFPWFGGEATGEEVKAYTHLITALCDMARNQKRITARERDTDNDKYAFRCFLLRLGFIGAEYKEERKILLRNLTGNGAFKAGARKEAPSDATSK